MMMTRCAQALGIPTEKAIMSEKKKTAQSFLAENWARKILALFSDMEEVTHGRGAEVLTKRPVTIGQRDIDILCMSAPCQPFSDLRTKRS
eukprot:8570444-Lingulodinium_polyedra.AAC.1